VLESILCRKSKISINLIFLKNPNLNEKWTNMMFTGFSDYKNMDLEKMNYLLLLEENCLEQGIMDDNMVENWILMKIFDLLKVSIHLEDGSLWIVDSFFFKPTEKEMNQVIYQTSKSIEPVRVFFLN
jgi:hypothetical protein